jgi:hypothetical protein
MLQLGKDLIYIITVINVIKLFMQILIQFTQYPFAFRRQNNKFCQKLHILFPGCCYETEYPELQEFTVDIGGNITLPCRDSSIALPLVDAETVMWVREGRDGGFNRRMIEADGDLTLTSLERDDAGIYACTVEGERGSSDHTEVIRSRVKVEVRSEYVLQFSFFLIGSSLVIKLLVVNFSAVHIFQSVGEICLYPISFVPLYVEDIMW